MKQLMKVALMLVLLVSVLGAGLKADAAVTKPGTPEKVEKKPYEYEFEVDDTAEYNGFTGAKKMVVTFDKVINPILLSDVYVEQMVDGKGVVVPIVASVAPTPPSTSATKELIITFKNLELIDHVGKEDFQLVIKQGKLYFDQITDYVLPFKFYDLTPGFESVFVTGGEAAINNNIFKHNEPRNIMIQVPPIYITKIETIHRYKGLTDKDRNAPNLSNIDVIADNQATRLKVKMKSDANSRLERDLNRSTAGVNGFSMGQAGIEDLTCVNNVLPAEGCKEYKLDDDFELTAYSKDGRKLETKEFKMRVNDQVNDFKINDYITADLKFFGKPISLYELMASPTLLDKVVKEIEVRKLNDLGVVYSVGNKVKVEDPIQLEMALNNPQLKDIDLNGKTIKLSKDIVIKRDLTIHNGKIEGNLTLGKEEKDTNIRMFNMGINGNVVIDVGDTGTVILDSLTSPIPPELSGSIIVKSAGQNSIHIKDSKMQLVLENEKPIRIVSSDSLAESNFTKSSSVVVKGKGVATLEGKYENVTVNNGVTIELKPTTLIYEVKLPESADAATIKIIGGLGTTGKIIKELPSGLELPNSNDLDPSDPDDEGTVPEATIKTITADSITYKKLTEQTLFNLISNSSEFVNLVDWKFVKLSKGEETIVINDQIKYNIENGTERLYLNLNHLAVGNYNLEMSGTYMSQKYFLNVKIEVVS